MTVDESLTPEAINHMLRSQFPGATCVCVDIGADYATAEMLAGPDDLRPGGFISGSTQFGIADCALWFLTFVALGRIEPMALTSELSIRFLRPAVGSGLRCTATLESRSRRSVVGTARVWAVERPDKITATAQGTYAVPLP